MEYLVAAFFGIIFGNFATTYFHRLPLGKPINGRLDGENGMKPHCSKCGQELKYYEYLPVLSWIFAFGRCNYCGSKIDVCYHILEIGSALYAIVLAYFIGISFIFIPMMILGISILLQLLMYFRFRTIYLNIVLVMISCIGLMIILQGYDQIT